MSESNSIVDTIVLTAGRCVSPCQRMIRHTFANRLSKEFLNVLGRKKASPVRWAVIQFNLPPIQIVANRLWPSTELLRSRNYLIDLPG
jgi:hypothetical protein